MLHRTKSKLINALKMWYSSNLGMTVTNHNCIHEEIKNRLNSGNVCWNLFQNLLLLHLLAKNVRIGIQFYLLFGMGVKLGLTLREEHRLWCLRKGFCREYLDLSEKK
jgi:hypothetical protein